MNQTRIPTQNAGHGNTGYLARGRRFGELIASLFAFLLSGIAAADGTPRGQFAVWAIGLPNGYVIMEHQASAVRVTDDDVARGVLDVQNGTRIVITTTEPTAVVLQVRSPDHPFRAVQVDGIGGSAVPAPTGNIFLESQPATGRRVITVSYRFLLAPDATPGTYAWPLAIAARRSIALEAGHARGTRTLATVSPQRH